MKKYQVWAMAFSVMAIASGIFPNSVKADGCPDCEIPPPPPCEDHSSEHCVVTCHPVTDDCPSPKPKPSDHELYSKHKPYCGYLNPHDSPHWSDRFNTVETLEESSSEKTSFDHESEIPDHLVASAGGYSPLSTSTGKGSSNRYSSGDSMQGENALVLLIGIGVWVALRPLFSKKDAPKS